MSEVEFPTVDGGTLRGYVATPDGQGPWPAVVVVHELFGLTDDVRRQADRFAVHGYLALAPDLYSWAATPRCLVTAIRTVVKGEGRSTADLVAARDFLRARADCTGQVGIAGFCLGGALAILAAPEGFDVAAPSYGKLPPDLAQVAERSCPVVASYGARDRQLPGAAARLEAAYTAAGVEHDVKEYPTAKHGFLFPHTGTWSWTEPLVVAYDEAAADDAWRRIFAFFGRHLTPHR